MIKHKSHLLAVPVDTGNTMSECGSQIFHRREQYVGQHRAFKVAPKSFNQVQARAIRRQPEHGNPITMTVEPLSDGLGMMESPIVANQANLSPGISGHQGHQKHKEIMAALGLGYCINDLAGLVIDSTIDHPLFILPRRRNLGLLAHRAPHLRQGRMPMNLHLILKNQGLLGLIFHRFFFKRTRSFLALVYACSSRLPLRVCLGRWIENPSLCRSLRN